MIKVDYEVLPHVTDVEAAMAPDAPIQRAARSTCSQPWSAGEGRQMPHELAATGVTSRADVQ